MSPTDADRAAHVDAYAEAVSSLAGLCVEVEGDHSIPSVLLAAYDAPSVNPNEDDPVGLMLAALDLLHLAMADGGDCPDLDRATHYVWRAIESHTTLPAATDSTAALWAKVDERRRAHGTSMRALARILGAAPSTLSRWSRGSSPSAEVALRALAWVGR